MKDGGATASECKRVDDAHNKFSLVLYGFGLYNNEYCNLIQSNLLTASSHLFHHHNFS